MREARSSLRRELTIAASWALLVPVVLTLMMSSSQPTARELGWTYLVNLVITLSIGGCVRGSYALVALLPAEGWPQWLHHALALPAGLLAGSELALAAVRITMPFASIGGGRWMLWRIGGVVSLLVVGLSALVESWRARALSNELARAEASQQAVAAQLRAVQARLQPHFLFNALNTVAALVEEDPPLAVEAIERLSALLRRALDRAEDELVSLRDELAITRDYAALEKLRFEDRLVVDFDVRDEATSCSVPSFCLQPLVENAVRHGMAGRGILRVEVHATIEAGQLRITVRDDGQGQSTNPGTSRGHSDLRARLALRYGAHARLSPGTRAPRGYEVVLCLPVEGAPRP